MPLATNCLAANAKQGDQHRETGDVGGPELVGVRRTDVGIFIRVAREPLPVACADLVQQARDAGGKRAAHGATGPASHVAIARPLPSFHNSSQ